MVLLLALDLAFIPKTQDLSTIERLKEMQTMTKEKDSTLSNSEKIGMLWETLLVVAQYLDMPNFFTKASRKKYIAMIIIITNWHKFLKFIDQRLIY